MVAEFIWFPAVNIYVACDMKFKFQLNRKTSICRSCIRSDYSLVKLLGNALLNCFFQKEVCKIQNINKGYEMIESIASVINLQFYLGLFEPQSKRRTD
uniref:Uncharacterized protein MANES_04G136000 n=1 Tax=Rhizophora mucronata TaxID=61149 RepID=A0A2P2MUQ0_RHIMU